MSQLAEEIDGIMEASPLTIGGTAQRHLKTMTAGLDSSDDRRTAKGVAGVLAMLASAVSHADRYAFHGLSSAEAKPWKDLARALWRLNKDAEKLSQRPRRVSPHPADAGAVHEDQWSAMAARQKKAKAAREKKLGKRIKSVHHSKLKVGDRIYYGQSIATIKKIGAHNSGSLRFTLDLDAPRHGGPIITNLGLDPSYFGIVESDESGDLEEASELDPSELPMRKQKELKAITKAVGNARVSMVFGGIYGYVVNLSGAEDRLSRANLAALTAIKGFRWVEFGRSDMSVGF